jgi:dienelactone hydrolase
MIYLPKPDGTQDAPWQLTAGRYAVTDYVWSPKGWIFYTSEHEEEPVYDEIGHNSIYGFPVSTAAAHPKEMPATAFTDDLAIAARGLALSPDGNHFAFHAEQFPGGHAISHQQVDLMLLDLSWAGGKPAASGAPRNLTSTLAYEMGSGVGGDNTAPRGGGRGGIVWNADSQHLLDIAGSKGSALLLSVDTSAAGKVAELTAPKQAVLGFVATPDQTTTLALVSNPILIGDLFRIGPNQQQTQLTHVNDTLFSQLDLDMPLDLEVTPKTHAKDIPGSMIDTFIQLPPGIRNGRPAHPLPTILNIHGGPHSAYGWVFDHEMLYMAAKGYAVIYPNPRGSTTYGQQFANVIMNNYPGDDFHDLMDTVDEAVKLGIADPARLGVTGGSGGGLLTDWTVTQTTRFKAAVAQRDIVDWAGWWYTADAAGFHQSFYPKSPPFDNVELYKEHSPLTYVNNIKTPMMFILGEADYRTPPTSGGEEFFRALKYKHIPTVMVRFPRESHELSRSGEPWHRIERLENIVNWFDLYLDGICEPQYDVSPVAHPVCTAK